MVYNTVNVNTIRRFHGAFHVTCASCRLICQARGRQYFSCFSQFVKVFRTSFTYRERGLVRLNIFFLLSVTFASRAACRLP